MFLWERENDPFIGPKLEGWYEMNVWSHLIDTLFHNTEVNLKRGADRKNEGRSVSERKSTRKMIGRKGDGVFISHTRRLEFGAIEAWRRWEGKSGDKYLRDSLKLSKLLKDMLRLLFSECGMVKNVIRELQVVGILQGANRFKS